MARAREERRSRFLPFHNKKTRAECDESSAEFGRVVSRDVVRHGAVRVPSAKRTAFRKSTHVDVKRTAMTISSQHDNLRVVPGCLSSHTSQRAGTMSLASSVSLTRPSARVALPRRVRTPARRGAVVTRALGNGGKSKRPPKGPPKGQGDLEKKRCDLCLGTGVRKCYGCHVAEGWRADNFSTSKCERAGYVPIKVGGFLGIGGKDDEAKCGVCWSDPAKKPGTVQCIRCKGTKYIYFRNADWR